MPTTNTIHEEITAKIITAIEQGQTPPWRRSISDLENDGFPTRPATMKPFGGVDVFLLNLSAQQRGFHSRFWATEQEWAFLDGKATGQATILADGIPVFNADQTILSIGSVAYRSRRRKTPALVDYAAADTVIEASGADIRHRLGTEAAYYFPPDDYIVFPLREQFLNGPAGLPGYYDSIFHELVHFSEPRLCWDGSDDIRELRAEIAAPFMASLLGVSVLSEMSTLRNHQKHLSRWVRAMKQDPTLIFKVAADASEAVAYLLSLSQGASGRT